MVLEPGVRTVETESVPASSTGLEARCASAKNARALRAGSLHRAAAWQVVGAALVSKFLVFIFAAESYVVLGNEPIHGFRGWLGTLIRWDTVHYLNVAEHGYGGNGRLSNLLVLFPAYPWAVRFFSLVFGDYLISGLFVSGVASIFAAVLLYRLAALDFSSAVARRAAWFLFIFPTSYFLHLAYAESMFIAMVLGCILAARRQEWFQCGICGTLAGLTRVNGLVLIPVLAYEAAEQYSKTRRFDWRFLCAASPMLGLAAYLLVNLSATGDPFAFLAVQREHFSKYFAVPWTGLAETVRSIGYRGPTESQMVGTQELVFVLLGLLCTIYCWKKLRPSYSIWMTGNWLLATCTGFVYCVPRFSLTMFPIFMIFALVGRNRLCRAAITIWSLLFLALFTSLFVRGLWAF